MDMEEAGLDQVIRGGYDLLDMQTYFTAGVKEVRAWTVAIGATAPQAAGVIHTDFERGFIRAEVIAYDDFINTTVKKALLPLVSHAWKAKLTSFKMAMSCTLDLTCSFS